MLPLFYAPRKWGLFFFNFRNDGRRREPWIASVVRDSSSFAVETSRNKAETRTSSSAGHDPSQESRPGSFACATQPGRSSPHCRQKVQHRCGEESQASHVKVCSKEVRVPALQSPLLDSRQRQEPSANSQQGKAIRVPHLWGMMRLNNLDVIALIPSID